jgi:hypothetical protein
MEKVNLTAEDVEKMSAHADRMREMQEADRQRREIARKFASQRPVVTGAMGLASMFAMAALAEDRFMPYRPKQHYTPTKGKTEHNRKKNKAAAASRRKNRR